MKSIYSIVILLYLSIITTSCGSAYIPNVVNTPLLSEKGETQIAVHYGTSGINPQIAYAITNNIGVMVNANFLKNIDDDQVNNYGEIGMGYYTSFARKGRFEAYAGYGLGNYSFTDSNYSEDTFKNYSGDMRKYFLQPSIGFSSKIFEGSFTPRLAFVNTNDISEKVSATFLEPILTAKVGYKFIKTIFQIGLTIQIDFNTPSYLNNKPLIASLGVQLNINQLFNNK